MSRCFPFPPPGYEGKHRPEDLLVLKEARRKEKREKTDKERRKDREKRDKDRNSEKHGSKKDRKERHKERKEKHRDKKDEKKGKEEEINSVSAELEQRSGEKVHPESHSFDGSSSVSVDRCSMLSQGRNEVKPLDHTLGTPMEEKFIQEMNKRIRGDNYASRSQFPERVTKMEKGGQVAPGEAVFVSNHFLEGAGEKSRNLDNGVEFEVAPRVVELLHDKILEDERMYTRALNEKGREEIRAKNNEVHRNKEKTVDIKMEDKQKIKAEKNMLEIKNFGRTHPSGASNKNGCLSLDVSPMVTEGNLKKRKDMEINGFLHDGEIRPNKFQLRTIYSSTMKGRKPIVSRISSKSPEKHTFPDNDQLEHKDLLMNGMVKQPQNVTPLSQNASGAVVASSEVPVALKSPCRDSGKAKLNVPAIEDLLSEASKRPPHPDSKYLTQVLRVPSIGQWSEHDDQEWLFSKKDPPKKPDPEFAGETGESHVWSKALHIESVDVYALPYVIPF